jgi:tetratricopeptide (TPR) repeat protein
LPGAEGDARNDTVDELRHFPEQLDSLMTNTTIRKNRLVLIGFCAVLAFTWFCYQPAIGGAFQLDDSVNLGGLDSVEDMHSAIEFIFSGIAGPTGRPLALASFALQAEQWELGASAFLRVNILIHLINAALLALCLYQLSLQRNVDRNKSAIIAAAAASLWALMPLLATASLLVVQRMTTLSAMFMLLGLSGYLYARARVHDRPKQALLGMSASLVAGTVLATLCKESGLLLPVFVLVLEATVLERPGGIKARVWRIWQFIFLLSPLVLFLVYLTSWLDYSDALLARRGFNAWERLLTETRVLWIYLSKALVGIPSQLGIYQYPPTVSHSLFNPATFFASFAWFALLLASIAWRRRYPLFAVAVLWYLGGHIIESTVVSLELYFEHRNYMPIIGPLFALSSFLVLHPNPRRRRIAGMLVPVLAIVNAWFLYSFATLSGDPSLAARYWANSYPASGRAVLRMATYRLAEEGPQPALQTIDSFVTEYPEHSYMRLSELNLLCQYAPEQDHRRVIEHLERELSTIDYTHVTTWLLSELLQTTEKARCNGVDSATVASLAETVRSNPRYAKQPAYNLFYYKTLAYIALKRGDYDVTIQHLRQAIDHGQPSDLNVMMVMALGAAGEFAAARDFIDDAEADGPLHPVKAGMWRRDLDGLREYIRNLEKKRGEATEEPSSIENESEST